MERNQSHEKAQADAKALGDYIFDLLAILASPPEGAQEAFRAATARYDQRTGRAPRVEHQEPKEDSAEAAAKRAALYCERARISETKAQDWAQEAGLRAAEAISQGARAACAAKVQAERERRLAEESQGGAAASEARAWNSARRAEASAQAASASAQEARNLLAKVASLVEEAKPRKGSEESPSFPG